MSDPISNTWREYHQRINRVVVHLQGRLDEPVSLEELARMAHFSPYHFHRIFRTIVGEPLMEYVRRLRLERAAQQLRTSNEQVIRIAAAAGYETHEAFTRAFVAMFAHTPSEFRKDRSIRIIERPWPAFNTGDGSMMPQFQGFRDGAPVRVVFLRHIGPYGSGSIAQTWEKLCGWAGPRGLFNGPVRVMGIGHDDPTVTPPEKCRYDACITAGEGVSGEGEIGVQTIPGGRFAVFTHIGPYVKLPESYEAIYRQWLPTASCELREQPPVEVYMSHPNTPDAEKVTEILIPVK